MAEPSEASKDEDRRSSVGLELDYAIGFSGNVSSGLQYQKIQKKDIVYASGGSLVSSSLDDLRRQVFYQGHSDEITCVAMSASGYLMATGQAGVDSDVIVWDFKKKRLTYRFEEHDYGIQSVAFSHDERLLATLGVDRDRKLIVWDLATGNIVASMRNACFRNVRFGGYVRNVKRRDTPFYQIAAVGDAGVSVFSLDPYKGDLVEHAVNMGGKSRTFAHVAFSRDYELLYAGTTSGDVFVVGLKNMSVLVSMSACRVGVCSIEVGDDRDGTANVYVGGGDGTLSVWQKQTDYYGKLSYVKMNECKMSGSITSISLQYQDGVANEALVGTSDGSMRRVHLAHGNDDTSVPQHQLSRRQQHGTTRSTWPSSLVCQSHSDAVLDVAYSARDSRRFATCSRDCTVRIWDTSNHEVVVNASVRGAGAPSSVCLSTDHIFSGWADGKIRCHGAIDGAHLWDVHEAHKIVRGRAVNAMTLSNNEKFLLSGGEDGAVRLWAIRTKEMVAHFKEHKSRVSQIALFSDDVHAISCSQDRSFLCWDLQSERRISTHTQRTGGINSVALSCDESVVITCGKEQSVTFWDLRQSNPVQSIYPAHEGEATCIGVMHNNQNLFVTGGTDKTVRLWDMRTCRSVGKNMGHSTSVTACHFSPDDRQVVTTADDGGVFIWNACE